jgi:hypothetical protein
MPKLIISIDGVVIKEAELTGERTTLGRRPYNDIVIDNLAVSGEHAVLYLNGAEVFIEDLNSTNGTYVNGKAIKHQLLQNNDIIEVGKYKIRFQADPVGVAAAAPASPAPHVAPVGAATAPSAASAPASAPAAPAGAVVRLLNGAAAGREVPLVKVVTTIGKPGVAVAAITRRAQGFMLSHVDGTQPPTVNGTPIGKEPVNLHDGDLLELAGIQMQFVAP